MMNLDAGLLLDRSWTSFVRLRIRSVLAESLKPIKEGNSQGTPTTGGALLLLGAADDPQG